MRLPAFLRHVFPPPGAVEADRDGQRGMCVLPWLAFDGEISFGDVTIAGWSRVQGALELEVRTTAAQILAGFRDVRGNAVEPSLCWFSERGPTSPLSEDDVEILRDYIQLAALAALVSNRYLTHREQINAAHFARIYQNFLPGTETIALVRRRRDGSTTSAGWRLDELVFSAPAAAAQRPAPSFDQPLLEALATCVGAGDGTSTAIRESVTLFLQGNELDEYETHGQDVVWIASAIEQLCEVGGRNKDTQIAERITGALGTAWNADEKRTLRQWMREFYAKRSEIHGQEATTSHWPYWAHALLGTVSYVALVKHALAADGRYVLTDSDEQNAAALPHRIDCLRDADAKSQEEFGRCWGHASWERAMARIFQRFGIQR